MIGIVGYGAYLPRLRLSRRAVFDANSWYAPQFAGKARGHRTMANWDEDSVTMAVAGFKADDVDVVLHENTLTLSGRAEATADKESKNLLYRGIARRAFERRFQLADYSQVEGAGLEDGLLTVDLARDIPEEKKPRKIEIRGPRQLQDKAA